MIGRIGVPKISQARIRRLQAAHAIIVPLWGLLNKARLCRWILACAKFFFHQPFESS